MLQETTMAAPQTPFLRNSVNVGPGAGLPVVIPTKAGNAIITQRGEYVCDEITDADCRTAALARLLTKSLHAQTDRGSWIIWGTEASILSNQRGAPNCSRSLGSAL
jgi:hypothetical protein